MKHKKPIILPQEITEQLPFFSKQEEQFPFLYKTQTGEADHHEHSKSGNTGMPNHQPVILYSSIATPLTHPKQRLWSYSQLLHRSHKQRLVEPNGLLQPGPTLKTLIPNKY